MQPTTDRPLILGAFLCERVLEEKDGVLTAVRIFDRAALPAAVEGQPAPFTTFTLLVMVRRGRARPDHTLTVSATSPTGTESALGTHPVTLAGEPDEGVNIRIESQMTVAREGIYWLSVALDAEEPHLIPLRVTFVPAATPGWPQTASARLANQS